MSDGEKIYYGFMILAIVASVLASPFFYARSLKWLNRRKHKQDKQAHSTEDNADD